jgi:predicted metalloprotease
MLWRNSRQSDNFEDRRSGGGRKIASVGGFSVLIIALIVWLLGGNPMEVLQMLQPGSSVEAPAKDAVKNSHEEELVQFSRVVLADTEDVWSKIFSENKKKYRDPILVVFSNSVASACGLADAATGPFYCPGEEKLYIDLVFFEELQKKLNAPGDFVIAYVIAHEVGHHVQKLLGTMDKYNSMREGLSAKELNRFNVKLELQADFYAGVWANHAQKMKNILEKGDIEEAMNAASAIGDDRLQRQTRGRVVPDSFTHGTSAQRMHWFKLGYETGDISQGDTFVTKEL